MVFGMLLLVCMMCVLWLMFEGDVYYWCCVSIMVDVDEFEVSICGVVLYLSGLLCVELLVLVVGVIVLLVFGEFYIWYFDLELMFVVVGCVGDCIGDVIDCSVWFGVLFDLLFVVCWFGVFECVICVSFVYFDCFGVLCIFDDLGVYCVICGLYVFG